MESRQDRWQNMAWGGSKLAPNPASDPRGPGEDGKGTEARRSWWMWGNPWAGVSVRALLPFGSGTLSKS